MDFPIGACIIQSCAYPYAVPDARRALERWDGPTPCGRHTRLHQRERAARGAIVLILTLGFKVRVSGAPRWPDPDAALLRDLDV